METISLSRYTNKMIGNTAFMLLNKPIGISTPDQPAIAGEAFASEIYDWKSQGKDVTVKINCVGGNVYRGWDIVDSIIETKAKTENIGFAYSMAGIALIVGTDRTAYPHSRAMIHAPRPENGKKNPHTELVMDQFRTILKNHTKFTEAEINEMIDSGKDYFFDAKQQLEKGIVDRISNTGGYNNDVMMLSEKEACAYINRQLEQNENTMEIGIDKLWAKLTGKESQAEQMIAFTEMKAQYDGLIKDKTAAEAKVTELEAKVKALESEKEKGSAKAKGTELIGAAIKSGKLKELDAKAKESWIENATANYEVVKSMIESLPSGKHVAAATIPKSENKSGGEMTYEWLMKNDPKELARIAEEDEALFNKLSEDWVAKQKENAK